jgi:hypothetical protein
MKYTMGWPPVEGIPVSFHKNWCSRLKSFFFLWETYLLIGTYEHGNFFSIFSLTGRTVVTGLR